MDHAALEVLFFFLFFFLSLFSYFFLLKIASELTPWSEDHPIKSQWQQEERENLSSVGRLQVDSHPFLPSFSSSF